MAKNRPRILGEISFLLMQTRPQGVISIASFLALLLSLSISYSCYTERHKSLHDHTQRSACLKRCASFKINDSKGEYAIYYDAVYRRTHEYWMIIGTLAK
jgi:hypothetical protein